MAMANFSGHKQLQSCLVEIPDRYINGYDGKPYINSIVRAKSLSEQLIGIKTIFLQASESENPEIFQFLSDLYFHCSINHPIRNQIAKLFAKNNEVLTDYVMNSIENLLKMSVDSVSCTCLNSTVVSVSGCSQNFSHGKKALTLKLDKFVYFLCASLENYLDNLGHENSPSLRNELFSFVHNSIRVLISCIQEFADVLKLTRTQMEFIKNSSNKLIYSNDTPMDTKTNLGILVAYISRIYDDYNEHVISVSKLINNPKEYGENLCKCIGIINTFSVEDFKKHPKEIILITDSISLAAKTYSNEINIYLATTRALKHLSKTLLLFDNVEKVYIENILVILLDYSLLYIEHDMDGIRHMCKDMLRNIVQSFKNFKLTDLMDCYLKTYFAMNSISKKCIIFSIIASVVDSTEILLQYPEIFTKLFKVNIKESTVHNLYEVLMVKSYKEIDFPSWKSKWIDFLLNIYNDENNADTINCIEFLFNKAVTCDIQVINIILNSNVRLSTKFSILWTVRKNGLLVENFQIMLNEIGNNFKLAFLSDCDDTKIMALRLLVETHKSTEIITEMECENILLFLIYNSNLQNPSTRSKVLRLLIKLLVRLEVNLENKKKELYEKVYLLKFLKDILSLLSNNLFPGANFSRKSISLNLLKLTIQILIKCNLEISCYIPTNFTNIIFKILNDPYIANKSFAIEILNLISTESILYEVVPVVEGLLISVRPSDSLTAAYHIEHICNVFALKEISALFNINGEVPKIQSTYYCALIWCMNILKNGIKIANKSILLAAKLNPLYGSLNAIKHLVLKLNFKEISTDILWKSLLTELIDLCKISCGIARPIVTNCSPEGHLPNDFTENVEIGLQNENICDTYAKNLKITSQMVLLCAWRTVKEVCIILGEIILQAPVKTTLTQSEYILEFDQIYEIGELLKRLLLETKHRGAFELAYVGFFKLCILLWKINHTDLNNLPMKWLKDIMNIILIDNVDNNKICATRRGGGIPFMVQALLISELEVESTSALQFSMQKLFEVCNEQSIYNFISRTHAFNILRALYRCKELNNVIGENIADGVIVAIRGYTGLTWSEKNSAALLFSALIVRIFGVQETKALDQLNIKNKMTGRTFFMRYSKLYEFFLIELKIANKLIEENESVNNLQPILLIFCRLYGSALEGTDSNLKLNMFIPFLSNCAGSRNMHTRLLAAKAVASIVPIDMTANQILNILSSYKLPLSEKRYRLNYTHGLLLQVKYLLKNLQNLPSELIQNILNELNYFEKTTSRNIVILKTILDIKIYIAERMQEISGSDKLMSFTIIPNELSFYYPVVRQSLFIYNFHILRLQIAKPLSLNFLLNALNSDEQPSVEQTDAALSIIVLIVFKNSSERNAVIDELEIFENEFKFITTLSLDSFEILYNKLITSKKIKIFLNRIIKNRNYAPKCIKKSYAILSQLCECPFNLIEILSESKKQHEDIKTTMALCVERLVIQYSYNDENNLNEIFEYLISISQQSAPNLLRLRSSRVLSHLSKYLNMYIEKKMKKVAIAFVCITLCLLLDDDPLIRNEVSKIVVNINAVDHLPKSIVPAYAQLIFIDKIASTLKGYYHLKDNDFIKSFFMELINFHLDMHKKEDDLNTEDLFDKNEENLFAEKAKVILDCKEVYFKHFADNL